MLGLLQIFFRKQEADPATSLAATRRWISSLPLQDEYEAHHMIVNALNLFNSSTEPLNQERLQVLQRLDESCQGLQSSLCRQYVKNRATLKQAEKQLWQEIFALYWHLAHGYQAFVREIIASRGEGELSAELPQVTTRAMHYFGMEVKWRYFHQKGVEPNMWSRLHKLYRIAESARFEQKKIELAEGQITTCRDEYLQILLLDLLAPTSLKLEEIEAIDSLLNFWSKKIVLERKPVPDQHTHWVNLSEGTGATCFAGSIEEGEKLRYFNMQGVLAELSTVINGLRAGELPEKFHLHQGRQFPGCLHFLENAATLWQRGAASRVLPREKERRPAAVACGLEAIKLRLKSGAEAVSEPEVEQEYWALENESDKGAGLRIDTPAKNPPCEGNLVGVRALASNARWEIGVVRWVKSSEMGRVSVGLEKLSCSPRLVSVSVVEDPLVAPGSGADQQNRIEGLFLPRVDEYGMASSLILPAELHSSGKLVDLYDSNVIYRVRLTSELEKSSEWCRTKFDILGRRQN